MSWVEDCLIQQFCDGAERKRLAADGNEDEPPAKSSLSGSMEGWRYSRRRGLYKCLANELIMYDPTERKGFEENEETGEIEPVPKEEFLEKIKQWEGAVEVPELLGDNEDITQQQHEVVEAPVQDSWVSAGNGYHRYIDGNAGREFWWQEQSCLLMERIGGFSWLHYSDRGPAMLVTEMTSKSCQQCLYWQNEEGEMNGEALHLPAHGWAPEESSVFIDATADGVWTLHIANCRCRVLMNGKEVTAETAVLEDGVIIKIGEFDLLCSVSPWHLGKDEEEASPEPAAVQVGVPDRPLTKAFEPTPVPEKKEPELTGNEKARRMQMRLKRALGLAMTNEEKSEKMRRANTYIDRAEERRVTRGDDNEWLTEAINKGHCDE